MCVAADLPALPRVALRGPGAADRVAAAHDDAELARLDADSDVEVIVADGPLDPAALVEDELLLTVPYVPRHEGNCPV